jgi:hypothetical protein
VASENADSGSKWDALARLDKGGRIQRRMATWGTPETLTAERAYLSPDWVEWLMGFPEGWTDIDPARYPGEFIGWAADPAEAGSTPRVCPKGTLYRGARLKALGNAQVPAQAAYAWRLLTRYTTT